MAFPSTRKVMKICNSASRYRTPRVFSTSAPKLNRTHYDTLGVSTDASRMDIKSKYFKLSKLYHPDMTNDPSAKAKFHQVSEAYAVLGNDRQRRAYDRKLSGDAHRTTSYTPPSSSHLWTNEMHERRRRGATHAWEQHPRRQQQSYPNYQHRPPGSGAYTSNPHGQHYDPSLRHSGRRESGRTGSAKMDEEERRRQEHDRLMGESALGRFARVLGLVLLITSIGGGWSAHAS